jgi:hypothetical protein
VSHCISCDCVTPWVSGYYAYRSLNFQILLSICTMQQVSFWIKTRVMCGINCRKQLIFINSLELPTLLLRPGCLELEGMIIPWRYHSKMFIYVTQKFSIIVILCCPSSCVLRKSRLMRAVVTDVTYAKFPFKFERTLFYSSCLWQCISVDTTCLLKDEVATYFFTFSEPCIVIHIGRKDQQDAHLSH